MESKEREARKAIAAINIILAEFDLWPEDERTLKAASSALERYV